MKKISLFLFATLIFCLIVGCVEKKETKANNEVKEIGLSVNTTNSKYLIHFENINENNAFKYCKLWVTDFENNIVKDKIEVDISSPVKNIYQRDFNGDGNEELLIITEPYVKGQFFDFGVYSLDKDFKATEVFCGDGSLLYCDYWFLTEDNCLIHLKSIRNYANENNAVYKSRYICETYTPENEKGELVFESGVVKKTKNEMDNLKEIMKVMNIPENALIISNKLLME